METRPDTTAATTSTSPPQPEPSVSLDDQQVRGSADPSLTGTAPHPKEVGWLRANSSTPLWLPEKVRHPALGYGLAVLGQLLATAATLALGHAFPQVRYPGALGFLVTVLVALNFGPGPSTLSAILAAIFAEYTVLPSSLTSALMWSNAVGIVLYAGAGLCISWLAGQTARARRGAAQRSKQLQNVFDAMGDGIVLYDQQANWVAKNEALLRMLGIDSHSSFDQLSVSERMARLQTAGAHGQPLTLSELPMMRALRGEEVTSEGAADLHVYGLNGRQTDLSITAAPLRNAAGQVTGAVAVFRDVTERIQWEERTREALEALLAMAEILVSGSAGRVAEASTVPGGTTTLDQTRPLPGDLPRVAWRLAELTRRMLGCSHVAISTVDPESDATWQLAMVGPGTPPGDASSKQRSLGELVGTAELAQLRAGTVCITTGPNAGGLSDPGATSTARAMLIAPCLLQGSLVGILSIDFGGDPHTYTVDERALAEGVARLVGMVIERERLLRERAEAQASALALREANQRMDEFLAIAGHELRTPLTTVKANAQMAGRRVRRLVVQAQEAGYSDTGDAAALEAMLSRMAAAVDRQDRLVSDLLDMSRIQTGGLELWPALFDLAGLVRDVIRQCHVDFPERTLQLALPENAVQVYADRDRIGQVIVNYLTNALKYSPAEEPIEIQLETGEGCARTSVRDYGPGISGHEQAYIWDRFHQVPNISPLSGSSVGLGLGLYITRHIVERHQGTVDLQSAHGQGSVFSFTLPLAVQSSGS